MGVDMKVKAIYDSEIGNITRSEKNWKDVLKVAGQLYRYEFDNIVMVTAQRPPEKSTLMADYDTWKKVGRYVKRGAKGCAIFPSRALNPRMRYIFDISDTGGKNVKLTWDLEGENLKDYVDFLVSEGQIEQYDNSDRESLKNILKQFTGTDVWLIIKEEFGNRMTELMQLSGSVIKEESKKRNGLQQEMDMEQLVYASVMYAVGTRCGFDLSVQEQDFSQIVNIKDEEIIYRLGSIVCDVSCSVLREFSRNLKAIESERRIGYVRRNDLQGSGRTALSADRDAGRDGGSHEAGQIRKDGDELSKGERAGKIQDADEIREDVREDVSGRGGSEPAVRPVRDAVSGEAQATESVIDNGDVEDKRAGEDAGRGSGTESDSDAIPLESDDTELNRELDEINSLGVSKEAEYTQASFFFDQNGQASIGTIHTEDENNNQFMRQFEQDRKAALAGKYNYLNPKKSATVPSEYIKQVLMRGTGFIGGKGRVCKIFETEIDAGTRAKRIKAEYGQGGAGWPVDGLGLHGYDTFHGNGLRFQWRDEDGEVEGYVSWKDIEKELGVLILTGEYQPETPRIDELAMDGLREDDKVIDAEYKEVEPEEAESEIDDYAIPDEPESYASNRDYVSAKGMSPQEAADEDRMVTQAEYGAEIEAETTEKDPSELQYITPIDYAKRIAELDEDLRDAAEILVTDCSCYTPFRAFLMDVVQSDFAFMPNKLDLIRDIALGADNAERKAYSNKGSYGKILIIAGNETMSGAACFAAEAALRMGAGLVKVLSDAGNRQILQTRLPEILFGERKDLEESLEWCDCILFGPGVGVSEEMKEMLEMVLKKGKKPLVIDADGLNIISRFNMKIDYPYGTIMTPHLMEAARLMSCDITQIKEDLCQSAQDLAEKYHCTAVLKDATTIVAREDDLVYINQSGNDGMATGGSGDVLAGMITGLLGEGLSVHEAAVHGVYLHGLAGDHAKHDLGAYSMIASDIIAHIKDVTGGNYEPVL